MAVNKLFLLQSAKAEMKSKIRNKYEELSDLILSDDIEEFNMLLDSCISDISNDVVKLMILEKFLDD